MGLNLEIPFSNMRRGGGGGGRNGGAISKSIFKKELQTSDNFFTNFWERDIFGGFEILVLFLSTFLLISFDCIEACTVYFDIFIDVESRNMRICVQVLVWSYYFK